MLMGVGEMPFLFIIFTMIFELIIQCGKMGIVCYTLQHNIHSKSSPMNGFFFLVSMAEVPSKSMFGFDFSFCFYF